jgi:hypothetical protein
VFLPTDFIGTEKWFWTDRLAHMLLKAEVRFKTQIRSLPPAKNKVVNTIETLSGSADNILETAIELLKGQSVEKIEDALSEFSQRWEVVNKPEGRAFLTWKEVRKMGRSGLISYGSHTVKHKILTQLKDQEVGDELERSKKELIERCAVSPSFIPFCYPNGNHNDRIAMLVKEAGYHLAVTTKHGYNRSGCDSFKLSRIGVHQDVSSTMAMYGCRLTSLI